MFLATLQCDLLNRHRICFHSVIWTAALSFIEGF